MCEQNPGVRGSVIKRVGVKYSSKHLVFYRFVLFRISNVSKLNSDLICDDYIIRIIFIYPYG